MRAGVISTCEKYGMKYICTDAKNTAEKQISDIEDLITRHVDVLLVNTHKADAIGTAVQKALDAKIPVVVMSSEVPGVTPTVMLTSNSITMGESAAKTLLEKMGSAGGKIIHLSGLEGSTVNQQRSEGIRNVINANPNVKIVASLSCNYNRNEALTAMEDLLKVHPDVKGVIVNGDDMGLGAIQALDEAGISGVPVVSCADGVNEEVYAAVEKGKMISQRNSTFGAEAVEAAVKILKHEPIESRIVIDAAVINPSNVDYFRKN